MSVIDLGELRDPYQPVPPVRPRRPAPRLPLVALALLVTLVTLAASSPLPVRQVAVVPFLLGGEVVVADDLLLVIDPSVRRGGPRTATAYRLPGVERVWQTTLPQGDMYWNAVPLAGLLLLSGYHPQTQDAQTVAVDPRTGAHRWQQSGQAVDTAGGGLLLEDLDEDRSGTVRAVDPCCGTPRWQVPVPAGGPVYGASGRKADRLVLAAPDGRVEVRDAGSGAVLAAADLPVPRNDSDPLVQVVGDLLVIPDGGRLTAYGLDRLDRRWQTAMPGVDYAINCGTVVCGHASDTLAGFDAATGRVRWARERWNPVWADEGHLIVTPLTSTSGDLIQLLLVDPGSGGVRAELGRWRLLGRWNRADPLLVVRPRAQPPGGLVVGEVDLATATTRVVDVLPDADRDCRSVDGDLLCRRRDGSLGLWPSAR